MNPSAGQDYNQGTNIDTHTHLLQPTGQDVFASNYMRYTNKADIYELKTTHEHNGLLNNTAKTDYPFI